MTWAAEPDELWRFWRAPWHSSASICGAAAHAAGYGDAYGAAGAAAAGQKRTYADTQGGYQQVQLGSVTPFLVHQSFHDAERVLANCIDTGCHVANNAGWLLGLLFSAAGPGKFWLWGVWRASR